MHVLEYIDYEVRPTEEAFLIKPLRDLYNDDKSKNKETFMKNLSVIYFMADPRSTYSYLSNDDERLKEIIAQEGLPEDFEIKGKLKDAIDIYQKHVMTTSYFLLKDTRLAIDKVRQFLRDVDLSAVDDKGKPLYTINNIVTALKQIPQLATSLADVEKIISKEIEEEGRIRGGNDTVGIFEEGNI